GRQGLGDVGQQTSGDEDGPGGGDIGGDLHAGGDLVVEDGQAHGAAGLGGDEDSGEDRSGRTVGQSLGCPGDRVGENVAIDFELQGGCFRVHFTPSGCPPELLRASGTRLRVWKALARYCSENFTQPIRFLPSSAGPGEKGAMDSGSRIRESPEILCSNISRLVHPCSHRTPCLLHIERSSRWRVPSRQLNSLGGGISRCGHCGQMLSTSEQSGAAAICEHVDALCTTAGTSVGACVSTSV